MVVTSKVAFVSGILEAFRNENVVMCTVGSC